MIKKFLRLDWYCYKFKNQFQNVDPSLMVLTLLMSKPRPISYPTIIISLILA